MSEGVSDRQEIETLREIVANQPLARRRPDDPGWKAERDADEALDALAASLAESEAREKTLRETLIPARDLTVAVMDKNIGELSDRARALLGELNAACGDISTSEEVQAIFAAAALAAVPSPAADGDADA